MKNSHELKEAAKDYDVVYIYLCSESKDSDWRGTIKLLDLTGENSVHYNLPRGQQRAVEDLLHVKGFPTFILVDRKGNRRELSYRRIVDPRAFVRDLERAE